MFDWIITIPKIVKWEEYRKELDKAEFGLAVLNYRVRYFPKEMKPGDRCFVVWNGRVRGWMMITSLREFTEEWFCNTTGAKWPAGKYIQRDGPFHVVDGPPMKGFRGIRKAVRTTLPTLPCGCLAVCVCEYIAKSISS